jgi:hypothetical protein
MLVVGRHSGAPEWGRLSTSLGVLAEPQVPTLVAPDAAPEPRTPAPTGDRRDRGGAIEGRLLTRESPHHRRIGTRGQWLAARSFRSRGR